MVVYGVNTKYNKSTGVEKRELINSFRESRKVRKRSRFLTSKSLQEALKIEHVHCIVDKLLIRCSTCRALVKLAFEVSIYCILPYDDLQFGSTENLEKHCKVERRKVVSRY